MTRYCTAFCLLLAACASTLDGPQERTYLCDGGRLAAVTFYAETALLRLTNDTFELRHESSGSGARYRSARAFLRIKEDEALLTVDGRELGPCQEVKTKS